MRETETATESENASSLLRFLKGEGERERERKEKGWGVGGQEIGKQSIFQRKMSMFYCHTKTDKNLSSFLFLSV